MTVKEEKVENVCPYGGESSKHLQVEEMFDNIAPAYDKMNQFMSLGMCGRWCDKAITRAERIYRQANSREISKILDVATGTGDVAIRLNRKFRRADVVGIDLSRRMLDEAIKKSRLLEKEQSDRLSFQQADCLSLPFPDDSFDMITVAYGVRNFEKLEQGYREMYRVLKPGSIICVVELSEPENNFLKSGYKLYSRMLIPMAGKIMSGDFKAYSYLPQSIAAAPQRGKMTELMQKAGFRNCSFKSLTLGVVTIYTAQK